MKAIEFVREMSLVAPTIASLVVRGLSVEEADAFRKGYFCTPRISEVTVNESNEVFDLILGWDVSKLEIGMLRFSGNLSRLPGQGTQIGVVEIDPLILFDSNSEIGVWEFGTVQHVLWKVARSPGQFLDAVLIAAKFFSDRVTGIASFDDMEAAKTLAAKCSEAAGGEEYIGFFCMLFGVEW